MSTASGPDEAMLTEYPLPGTGAPDNPMESGAEQYLTAKRFDAAITFLYWYLDPDVGQVFED